MGMTLRRRKEEKLAGNRAVNELGHLVEALHDENGAISVDGLHEFADFIESHNLSLDQVEAANLLKPMMIGLAQGGNFIERKTSLILKQGEEPLFESPATLLKEVVQREIRGGSQGVSIPLGRGIRYRVGAYRGQLVTVGAQWSTADTGQLTVTDQRIVYHGARKTLEFLFTKLATLNAYSDGVAIGVTNREATSTFRTGDPELLVGMIHGAIGHQGQITIIHPSESFSGIDTEPTMLPTGPRGTLPGRRDKGGIKRFTWSGLGLPGSERLIAAQERNDQRRAELRAKRQARKR
jgi:hypothetical protein